MTTQVKKFTGGVPVLPGEEGLVGQTLVKLSNVAGDYGWQDLPVLDTREILHDDSYVRIKTDDGHVTVVVNGSEVVQFRDDVDGGMLVDLINGYDVDTFPNPPSPPATGLEMLADPNDNTQFTWTPNEVVELVNEVTTGGSTPTGIVTGFAADVPPAGWLECNGETHPQVDYPDLFAVIGDTFQQGETGNSFFYDTPDINQRLITGGVIGTDLYYVYHDISSDEYRLRRTNIANDEPPVASPTRWEIVLPGIVALDPLAEADIIDFDDAENLYIRLSRVGFLDEASLIKISNAGVTLIQTPWVNFDFYTFVVHKSTEEVSFTRADPGDYGSNDHGTVRKANNLLVEAWSTELNQAGNFGHRIIKMAVDQTSFDTFSIQPHQEVSRVDVTGSVVWENEDINGQNNGLRDVVVLPDGNLLVMYLDDEGGGLAGQWNYAWVDYTNGSNIQNALGGQESTYAQLHLGLPNRDVFGRGIHVIDGNLYAVESHLDLTYIFQIDLSVSLTTILSYITLYTPGATFNSTQYDLMTIEPFTSGFTLGGALLGPLNSGGLTGQAYDTFRIPDLRGEFIRGWDNNRGEDPGRIFGSRQILDLRAGGGGADIDFPNLALMYCIKT